jgi:Raf kinase inhibitor-like YbhB/YbcL family protein
VLVAAAVLAGCGGGSKASTTATTAQAGGAAVSVRRVAPAGDSEAVVTVGQTPITKMTFEHWMAVTAALSSQKLKGQALKDQVLGFLITSEWVFGEAAHLKIAVSGAEARQRLAQIKAEHFPKATEFKRYLTSAGESEADLLLRIKVELLEAKISKTVTAGKTATTEARVLINDFQKGFEARWKRRTRCSPGYVVEDCVEFKGQPRPQAASSGSATTSSTRAKSSAASTSASGEVYSPPGAMALSSPAFERNGTIPVEYTCDGANTSPPLQWQNLPAHTAELVLFILDDSAEGREGGIRWVVAGINPSLSGIAAGSLPAGAVVGLNSAGTASYGGICPPKGKSATIEFALWALSRVVSLREGFTPAVAEHEYATSELASAVTYANYQR